MSSRKRNNKISTGDKVTMGAVSLLGVIGGWNVIGNLEHTASAEEIVVDDVSIPAPTAVRPTPMPWPTIQPLAQVPRLHIEPLPTLASGGPMAGQPETSGQAVQETGESFALSVVPSAAPLPTLAPLPTIPEYVPPPPPPPPKKSSGSSSGGGGGGNTSKGS